MGDGDGNSVGTGSPDWTLYAQHPANNLGDGNGDGRDDSLGAPVNGNLHLEIDARLPHRGADGVNPLFVDRFTSLERLGGQFAPRGGAISATGDYVIRDGMLDLSGDLLRLTGVSFYDVGGGTVSGNLWSADGSLFNAERLALDANGVPRIYGTALGLMPFDDQLRIVGDNPYVFPYGLNAGGELVCNSDNRSSVTETFPVATALRDNGLPSSWSVSSLLALSAEMATANQRVSEAGILELYSQIFQSSVTDVDYARSELLRRQTEISLMNFDEFKQFYATTYNLSNERMVGIGDEFLTQAHEAFGTDIFHAAAPRGCRPDPNFDLSNVPTWLQNDPLSIVRNVKLNGDLEATGDQLEIPSIMGNPAMTVNFGEGNNALGFDVSYHNPELEAWENGERDATTLANLRHQRELKAHLDTSFSIASVQVGDQEITLPASGDMSIETQLKGLFPTRTPEDLMAHVSLNGQMTVNGDIVVPVISGLDFPALRIRRGAEEHGANHLALSAEHFSINYTGNDPDNPRAVEVSGELHASMNLDMDPVTVDGMTFGGEQRGHLDVVADDTAITIEMGGRFALPTGAYPTPVPVAIDRGYLGLEDVRIVLDPNISINPDSPLGVDQLSGTINGTINVDDLAGTVSPSDERTLAISSDASISITDGTFTIQEDRMDAEIPLTAHVEGNVDGNDQNIDFRSNLSIHDFSNDEGYSWRELSINSISGAIIGQWDDIAINAPEGTFGDAATAEFNGDVLPPGINITSDRDGLEFGLCATARVNTQVNGLRVTTPQGTFELTGQLVGTVELINTSAAPDAPEDAPPVNWMPQVGGIRLELRGGTVRQISGGSTNTLMSGGTLEISDNEAGQLRIQAHVNNHMGALLSAAGDFIGVTNLSDRLGVSGVSQTRVDVSEIQIDPDSIHVMEDASADEMCVCAGRSYYNFTEVDSISFPMQSVMRVVSDGTTLLTARASAEITGIQTDSPEAEYHVRIPLSDQTIDVAGGTIDIDAGSGSSRGRVRIDGHNAEMSIRVRPPEGFDVNFSHTQDGITYEITGHLTPTGEVRASLDISDLARPNMRLRTPSDPYTLTGDLTVTARNADGDVIGSGTVNMTTAYNVSGNMRDGRAHFELDVPETVLSGSITEGFEVKGITVGTGARLNIPIRGFRGEIDVDMRDPSNPSISSTWNLPSVGSGDDTPEIFIPSLEIAGFEGDEGEFSDLNINFHQDPQGQQVSVSANPTDGIQFETLPGPDGDPRQVRLTFSVGEADDTIVITGSSESSAGVTGSISPDGEITINVSDLNVNSEVDGHVRQPLQLDLTNLDTLAHIPGLQVHFNPTTNEVRFTATPPTPTLPTPPATFEEFFTWDRARWTTYQSDLEGQTHMMRLSEAHANVQRATGRSIPPGSGDIFVNMTGPLDVTLTADANLLGNLSTALEGVLDVRRALPAPPVCTASDCPAVVWSDQQTGTPTLYFTQTAEEGGTPAIHSEVPGILQEALGIPRSDVDAILRDLRIEVPEVISTVRSDAAISSHYSEDDLQSFLYSYFNVPTAERGTHRQFDLRGLIALANVRRSLGNLLTHSGNQLPVHGHIFRNDDYHSVSEGDGSDMQLLSILPATPAEVEAVLTNVANMGTWDHWTDDVNVTGSSSTGELLNDYDYTITTSTRTEGNIRIIHFHMTPSEDNDMEAYTRTVRLIPVTGAIDPDTGAAVDNGTLVVFDEHSDFNGPDHELPFPRTRISTEPSITWEGFLNGSLRALEPPQSSVTRHSTNRYAVTAGNILALIRTPGATARDIRTELPYDSTSSTETSTVRRVDFLTMGVSETTELPILTIGETAQEGDVRPYLVDRLGVPEADFNRWMRAREIPIEELRTSSGLDTQLSADAFMALATTMLNPPSVMSDIASDFGSATERYLLTIEHIKNRSTEMRGSNHFGDVLVFEDDRFHPNISQDSRRQGDTVDSLNIYYVPETLEWNGSDTTVDIDRFIDTIHHAEDYDRLDAGNFSRADNVPSPTLSSGTVDPARAYTSSTISLPGGLALDYLISSIPSAETVNTVGRLSAWRLEASPGLDDFLDNTGWWLIIPAEGGGHWVFRAGILNSGPSGSDNTGTVADTGRAGVVNFMEALVSSTLEYQRTGNREAWTSGRAIDYRVGEVRRIP